MNDKIPPLAIANATTITVNTAFVAVFRQSEPSAKQAYRLVEDAGVLSFWDAPEEDGYRIDDGDAL
jgi:hypothetical protein